MRESRSVTTMPDAMPVQQKTVTCPVCGHALTVEEMASTSHVCRCGYHFPIGAHYRLSLIMDPGSFRETGTGKDGMKIADLNAAIRAVHPVNISKQPEKTWRRYLLARPNLFDVDDPGPNARVRLRDTVARSAQRLANT